MKVVSLIELVMSRLSCSFEDLDPVLDDAVFDTIQVEAEMLIQDWW